MVLCVLPGGAFGGMCQGWPALDLTQPALCAAPALILDDEGCAAMTTTTTKTKSTKATKTTKTPTTTTSTHISVILDRTGSMEDIREETIRGFNSFLKEQQGVPGLATMTLVQFDSEDPYEVLHRAVPIGEVAGLTAETYVPRASTPLLDAMGRGILDLDGCLKKMRAKERPGKVLFVVVTDGLENASREFTAKKVRALVNARTRRAKWQFVFMGTELGSITEAVDWGVQPQATMCFDRSADGADLAWGRLGMASAAYRRAEAPGAVFEFGDEPEE